jgi:hypothetical protein
LIPLSPVLFTCFPFGSAALLWGFLYGGFELFFSAGHGSFALFAEHEFFVARCDFMHNLDAAPLAQGAHSAS